MSTETITEGRITEIYVSPAGNDYVNFARAIEQAVLQSEQVQAWKRDAERYQLARRKVCIVGNEFHIINLNPRYVAPDSAVELDSVIDAAIKEQP